MAMVTVAGAEVSYRVEGQGPGLVLVHGTGGDAESNWDPLIPYLAKDWTVVRPDYSGSGNTVDDGLPLTVEQLAAQVLGAARAAGLKEFALAGFSLGASISAAIAADNPEQVSSLILVNGFASSADTRQQLQFGLWRDLAHRDRSTLARLIFLTGFSPAFLAGFSGEQLATAVKQTLDGIQWDGMARQIDLDMALDITAKVARIKQPTLVIGSRHDHMVPVDHARWLARTIPDSRYEEMESGHLVTLERSEELAGLFVDFLGQQR